MVFVFGFCWCEFPGSDREIKRAGGELGALARAPCGRMVCNSPAAWAQSSLGIRSPNSRANWLSASLQLGIGIVHLLAIRSKAK